jgi:hypothetical protein
VLVKKIPTGTYQTPEEIETVVALREQGLNLLPAGEVKQKPLAEIARLKSYAAMKRLLA